MIGKQRFDLPGPLAEDKVVNVPRGGIRDTADLLMREGVIDQPYLFMAGALLIKVRNDLKYGEYQFPKQASLRDVVDTIIEGKVVQHAFTVAEGLTSDQVVQKLLENEVLTGNIREIPREGTLLPETYRFTRGTTREQMIQRMQQAAAARAAGSLGAPECRPADPLAGAARGAGLDHREGNRQAGGAHAGRGGVRQPAAGRR